jgi:hypothetical protein
MRSATEKPRIFELTMAQGVSVSLIAMPFV